MVSTSPNSGHTATLCSAHIVSDPKRLYSTTSHVRWTLGEIMGEISNKKKGIGHITK